MTRRIPSNPRLELTSEEMRPLILTRFTAAIFVASQERAHAAVPDTASLRGRRWRQKAPGPTDGAHRRGRGPRGATGRHLPAIWGSEVPQDAARSTASRGPIRLPSIHINGFSNPTRSGAPWCAGTNG